MDTQVLALFGTALSALIAALAYYSKARHERLRTTRTVLYYLLEMRHHFAVAEYGLSHFPEQYLKMAIAALKVNGLALSEEDREALVPGLKLVIREISTTRVEELGKQIVEPYLRVLAELARDDPVLAYSLKGREVLTRASTAIVQYVRVLGLLEPPPDSAQVKDDLLTDIDDFDRQMTLDSLAGASRQVAIHCGPMIYIRTRLAIRKQNQARLTLDTETGLNSILNKLAKRVIEHESQRLLQVKSSTAPTALTPSPAANLT